MQSSVARGMLGAAFALLLLSLVVPVSYSTTANLTTAPVYIHFNPKSLTGVPGGSVTVTWIAKNNGSLVAVGTSCELWFRLGTSGSWTRAGACLKPSAFPFTVPAHSTLKFTSVQSISPTFPAGTYQWKIVFLGTYGGVSGYKSHPGKVSVTIT